MIDTPFKAAAVTAISLCVCSCSTVKNAMPDIRMPKMPDLTGVKNMLPGSGDSVSSDDPSIPFNATSKLAEGHTLRLRLYEGTMTAREIFTGLTMVGEKGVAKIGNIGSAKIGGHSLPEAERMLQSVCRVSGHAAQRIHVHIISVENVRLVAINGDTKAPSYLPMWDGMRFGDALRHAGGRKSGSAASAVYLTRNGTRKFFSHMGALDAWGEPQAGDIITLSGDL